MGEKTYLKWYNKVGYGSGDVAGNVVYALLSSFVMIYLTDTVGLNSGVVGTLMMFSKLFDGVTDIFFGSMIDKTKSRMGKVRPWWIFRMRRYAGSHFCNSRRPWNGSEICMVLHRVHAFERGILHGK